MSALTVEDVSKMFCFQCEQTAGGSGCGPRAGVCGKDSETALAQDELTSALIGLACAVEGKAVKKDAIQALFEGMFTCVTNVDFDAEAVRQVTARVRSVARTYNAGVPASEFDLEKLWNEPDADVKSVKSMILFGLRGMAAYAHHAFVQDYTDESLNENFFASLRAIGSNGTVDELLPVALSVGEANYTCMELLDRANTTNFGKPVPTEVPLAIEPGPFLSLIHI